MKVTITNAEGRRDYPVDMDFTFEEAIAIKQVTKMGVGEMLESMQRGDDVIWALGFAVVGRMRAEPGFNPVSMLKEKVTAVDVDFTEDLEEGAGDGPLASGAVEAPADEPPAQES